PSDPARLGSTPWASGFQRMGRSEIAADSEPPRMPYWPCPGMNDGSMTYSPIVMVPPTLSSVHRPDSAGVSAPPEPEALESVEPPPQAVRVSVAAASTASAPVVRFIQFSLRGW